MKTIAWAAAVHVLLGWHKDYDGRRFTTVGEAATAMNCSKQTARKYLNDAAREGFFEKRVHAQSGAVVQYAYWWLV